MQDELLFDISYVCKMLGVTSRTLRFYEAKGIIQSTTSDISARRQYTEEQVSLIQNVLTLRMLGLSVRSIAELQGEGADLKAAVLSKRAEIYASIEKKMREIHLLNKAVSALESGRNIYEESWESESTCCCKELEIAELCTNAIIGGDQSALYQYVSRRLLRYMPQEVFSAVYTDMMKQLGEFICIDNIEADESFPNRIYAYLRHTKMGLKITYVIHHETVDGLWLGYYDRNN